MNIYTVIKEKVQSLYTERNKNVFKIDLSYQSIKFISNQIKKLNPYFQSFYFYYFRLFLFFFKL